MTAQDPKVTVLDPIDGIRVVVREPSWACQNCGHEFGTVLRMRGRKKSLGFIRCERWVRRCACCDMKIGLTLFANIEPLCPHAMTRRETDGETCFCRQTD
jgi:hypothetical protein